MRDLKTAHQADLGTLVERFGEAQDMFEKQQRLLSKRDERIKDLEDETQTLRQLLTGVNYFSMKVNKLNGMWI